jgi:hypothetical protein
MDVAQRSNGSRSCSPGDGHHAVSTNTSRPASPVGGHEDDNQAWSPVDTDALEEEDHKMMKTIAVLQFAPELGQVDRNIARANELLDAANIPDALDWLILPEMALSGRPLFPPFLSNSS